MKRNSIYCLESTKFPSKKDVIEAIELKDLDGFNWLVYRTKEGFYVRLKIKNEASVVFRKIFYIEMDNGQEFKIKNTNTILFTITGFESYCTLRDIIKGNYTKDIWNVIECMFYFRLEEDITKKILSSELI